MIWGILKHIFFKLYLNLIGGVLVIKEQILDRHRVPVIPEDQYGRTIVITGGSRGIGLEAVKKYLDLQCSIIIGCRNVEQAKDALSSYNSSMVRILPLDLMKMSSVREFARSVQDLNIPIHALVNNAGIMFGARRETEDGFESQLATNYIGHFLLTHLLLPSLEQGGTAEKPSRVVNVSSCAHFCGSWMDLDDLHLTKFYNPEKSYGNSKAAQIMFSQYLDSMLISRKSNVRVISLHPGVVYTDLYTHVGWVQIFTLVARCMMKTASQGGDTLVYAALATELDSAKTTGLYLENSRLTGTSSFSASKDNQAKLWEKTCQILNISNFGEATE
jgi:NAD(P)-dependent dehydrogenase (short-subunit alcohol dehydrogenase family)